ncbi:uncharacterized protein [Argopecten irradians]|uniref:uncharacterized protein n=1 Tax=Argopecten irradians TaxID=31199 RepID=UPI0037160B11
MTDSLWLNGPKDILCYVSDQGDSETELEYPLVNLDVDNEVRSLKTEVKSETVPVKQSDIGSRFEHFSSWYGLKRAISNLKHVASRKSATNCCQGRRFCESAKTPEDLKASEQLILRAVQNNSFRREIEALENGDPLPKNSSIRNLNPILDNDGLMRVGGRLRNSNLPDKEKNPIIIPKKHHVAHLLVAHFHCEVKHQGRLFTEGAIRASGFWIVGCRRLINAFLRKCVKCLKLRGKQQYPKMADLPYERLNPAPPFSHVGIHVFGPWSVVTRKTRGGQAQSKRWAVIFTCLMIRAVHIEVVEEMTSSSFINCLRRFVALRGEVKLIRSDCGTNFVGAAKELNADVIDIDSSDVRDFLSRKGITWKFNPPHSSHMGGVWERLIGVSRRILDSLLSGVAHKNLTHEVLTTFLAETSSIINSRPVTGIPADPDSPELLTPSTLLTMRTTHTVDSLCIEDFNPKHIYMSQWRCVQNLANCFWKRWKNEFLSSLQDRKKWQKDSRNVCEGDIVLLRDKTLHRNEWPMGVVSKAIVSSDSRVRKVEIRVGQDNVYFRPASEVVVLVPKE